MSLLLSVLAIVLVATDSDAAGPKPPTGAVRTSSIGPIVLTERCPVAQKAIGFYRQKYAAHRAVLGLAGPVPRVWYGCDAARRRAEEWRTRAKHARLELLVIHDRPGWLAAVAEVQRVFPGTDGFLVNCADAEGWNRSTDDRWVIYGGGPYYPGAEYARTFHGWMVGGPMQYMWPTFKGHYRHGLESLRSRGFKAKLPPPSDVRAWLSFTAQAIAAGWARWSRNDGSHWSASSRSCS